MSRTLRHEVKLVCDELERPALLAELALAPAGLRRLYAPRRVQSVYFDTADGEALAENIAGVSARQKLRLRWYGAEVTDVAAQLERKRRVNALGSKDVLPLDQPIRVAGRTRGELLADLAARCPLDWRAELQQREPVQWIAYEREYFTTFDRRVRVTVDRGLVSYDLRARRVLTPERPAPRRGLCVVELKAPAERRDAVEELLQHVPLLVGKCSKFVLASEPEHGP